MSAQGIFNEILKMDMSPVVITGRPDQTFEVLKGYLRKSLQEDQYLVYDGLMADSARELVGHLSLKKSPLEVILVNAAKVTVVAWQKCFKILEDTSSNTKVIFVSNDSDVPKAIQTRAFRCLIPNPSDDSSYSATDAFSVGSWVVSVDFRNREQLLKTCKDWSQADTDLLIRELGGIISNDSLLGLSVVHLDPARLMYAVDNLSKYRTSPTVALSTGLRLIG